MGLWMPSLYQEGEGQCSRSSNSRVQPWGSPGYGRRHERTGRRRNVGKLWSSRLEEVEGQRLAWTKKISRREEARVSDEAVVSDDPEGQHNPRASQGPLDWHDHAFNRSTAWPQGSLRYGEWETRVLIRLLRKRPWDAATYKVGRGAGYADFTLEPTSSTEGGSRRPV